MVSSPPTSWHFSLDTGWYHGHTWAYHREFADRGVLLGQAPYDRVDRADGAHADTL
jgi:hypothetical protein